MFPASPGARVLCLFVIWRCIRVSGTYATLLIILAASWAAAPEPLKPPPPKVDHPGDGGRGNEFLDRYYSAQKLPH